MFRKDMAAKMYKVLKPFVFRGVQYMPGNTADGLFDPVKAQCIPSKLGILIRQQILGDEGPSLAEAIKEVVAQQEVAEQPAEPISDGEAAADEQEEGTDEQEGEEQEQEPEVEQEPEPAPAPAKSKRQSRRN